MMDWMYVDQDFCLLLARKTRNQRVSIPHPVTVINSASWPLPKSLRKQRRYSRGMGSFGRTGRPIVCMGSGMALAARSELSPECKTTGIRSLI